MSVRLTIVSLRGGIAEFSFCAVVTATALSFITYRAGRDVGLVSLNDSYHSFFLSFRYLSPAQRTAQAQRNMNDCTSGAHRCGLTNVVLRSQHSAVCSPVLPPVVRCSLSTADTYDRGLCRIAFFLRRPTFPQGLAATAWTSSFTSDGERPGRSDSAIVSSLFAGRAEGDLGKDWYHTAKRTVVSDGCVEIPSEMSDVPRVASSGIVATDTDKATPGNFLGQSPLPTWTPQTQPSATPLTAEHHTTAHPHAAAQSTLRKRKFAPTATAPHLVPSVHDALHDGTASSEHRGRSTAKES